MASVASPCWRLARRQKRLSQVAEVASAVEGQLGAREPDLWAGRLSFLSAFSHMECEVSRLSPSPTVTPLSPGRGGARAGAAGVRRVCGMSVGPRAICHVRLALFHNTEG